MLVKVTHANSECAFLVRLNFAGCSALLAARPR
jgi:hypothetical protein